MKCLRSPAEQVLLMTAVARVSGVRAAYVRVFLDLGAQTSFVSPELVKAIKPQAIGKKTLTIQAFGTKPVADTFSLYRIHLTDKDGESHSIEVMEKPGFDMDLARPSAQSVQRWKERGVSLSDQPADGVSESVHILLGADYANKFLQEKRQEGGECVWNTAFGWIMSGPTHDSSRDAAAIKVSSIQTDVSFLWELDEPLVKSSDLPAFLMVKKGSTYEVGLLWKSEERPPDNRSQALAAANQQVKSLASKDKRSVYDDVLLREYQDLGAIEKEPQPHTPGYYLPHHAVIREAAETTKVRVVFNASAARKGEKSLNDVMDPGPSLLPDLTGMLLRFRELPVGLQADIRKAFFMIAVQEQGRQYLRFLWPDEHGVMTTWRLKRLPFGVNCSPFILTAVIQKHLTQLQQDAPVDQQRLLEALLNPLGPTIISRNALHTRAQVLIWS